MLESLDVPKSIDILWDELYSQMENDLYPARQSFDNLVLTIDILFAVGAVTLDQNGRLERCRLALPILLEARQVTLDQNRWLEQCASSS